MKINIKYFLLAYVIAVCIAYELLKIFTGDFQLNFKLYVTFFIVFEMIVYYPFIGILFFYKDKNLNIKFIKNDLKIVLYIFVVCFFIAKPFTQLIDYSYKEDLYLNVQSAEAL